MLLNVAVWRKLLIFNFAFIYNLLLLLKGCIAGTLVYEFLSSMSSSAEVPQQPLSVMRTGQYLNVLDDSHCSCTKDNKCQLQIISNELKVDNT